MVASVELKIPITEGHSEIVHFESIKVENIKNFVDHIFNNPIINKQ